MPSNRIEYKVWNLLKNNFGFIRNNKDISDILISVAKATLELQMSSLNI